MGDIYALAHVWIRNLLIRLMSYLLNQKIAIWCTIILTGISIPSI